MARLRRSDSQAQGISRRRRGRGFSYHDAQGRRISDAPTLERIRELVIPPAWEDVWICPDPDGHIQATGVDEAGRKQYRYHDRWQRRQAARKFESVREFGRRLPKLRRVVQRDLDAEDVPRERALACAVRLLDLGFFRIGGEDYAETNESYGLATLRREHVSVQDRELIFDYPAKSGQRQVQSVRDRAVQEAVEAMRRRRGGAQLIAYRRRKRWQEVRSDDINAYIKDVIGEEFSAKDFRTWSATVLAAVELAVRGVAETENGRRQVIRESVEAVAETIGNTPAVCRSSYIDPRVLDRYRDGAVIEAPTSSKSLSSKRRRRIEIAVLKLIE